MKNYFLSHHTRPYKSPMEAPKSASAFMASSAACLLAAFRSDAPGALKAARLGIWYTVPSIRISSLANAVVELG